MISVPENSFCEKCFTISTRNFDIRKMLILSKNLVSEKISVSVHGDVADGSDGGNGDNGDGGDGDDGGDDGDDSGDDGEDGVDGIQSFILELLTDVLDLMES